MKRPCEESSSTGSDLEDGVDVGRERSLPGHMRTPSFIRRRSPTTTPQVMSRKKRRGIIEKRRRDRINSSLLELRRLVPMAFEKQGSAKLEKAEILQMTVDHLKMMHATGGKGYWDAQALALDFLSLGFRECVMEVSRYLSTMEGLDAADPLRTRLLSHLTSCTNQRDAAALTLTSHHLHHLHQPPSASSMAFHPLPTPPQWALRPLPAAMVGLGALTMSLDSSRGGGGSTPRLPSHTDSASSSSSSSPSSFLRVPAGGAVGPGNPASLSTSLLSLSASVQAFPLAFPHILPPASFAPPPFASSSSSVPSSSSRPPQSSSGKPYRPWGTEVGAF